jgi:hemerythrin
MVFEILRSKIKTGLLTMDDINNIILAGRRIENCRKKIAMKQNDKNKDEYTEMMDKLKYFVDVHYNTETEILKEKLKKLEEDHKDFLSKFPVN